MAKTKRKEQLEAETPAQAAPETANDTVQENSEAETEKPKTKEIAKITMVGNLRDVVLDLFKQREKSWKEMTELEQKSLAENVVYSVEQAVERAVDLIAADGRKVIKGKIEQITVKDGYKVVTKVGAADPLRHELVDSQGKIVLLVVSDADAYDIERSDVETDADEPELPYEGGDEFDDEDSDDYVDDTSDGDDDGDDE